MKYQQNIISGILRNNFKRGFTLIEIIIIVTISTFLVILMTWVTFYIHKTSNKIQEKAYQLENISKFLKIVTNDVLSPDIYPRHSLKEYSFGDEMICFYASGGKVQYEMSEEGLKIFREYKTYINPKNEDQTNDLNTIAIKTDEKLFSFIKKLNINYYDKDDFLNIGEQFPYFCEMIFTFDDNKEVRMKMRL